MIEFSGQSVEAKDVKFVGVKVEDATPAQTVKLLGGLNIFWAAVSSLLICIFWGYSFANITISFALSFTLIAVIGMFLFRGKTGNGLSRSRPYLVYQDGTNIKVIEGAPTADSSIVTVVNGYMMIEGIYGEQIEPTNDTVGFTYDSSKNWVR